MCTEHETLDDEKEASKSLFFKSDFVGVRTSRKSIIHDRVKCF